MYQQYSDALYGIIFRILNRKSESEEVLQTVFLKIWNHIDSYDPVKATIYTWMSQIARNAAIDVKRLKSFEFGDKTTSLSHDNHDNVSNFNVSGIDVPSLTKQMPEKYKILVDKMFLQGYTQQEISDELNIPLGTVKTRLREAINLLRGILKNERHLLYMLSILG